MAAPPTITSKNLTGKFFMNKTLSDDLDEVLKEQGVSWLIRKAISIATITLDIKHYTEEGVEHIDIEQSATGGIKGTTENRTLDWKERPHEDYLFGKLTGQSRRIKLEEVTDEFLKAGWLEGEAKEDGLVESFVVSVNGWSAHQIWGFEEFDGKRYYTRHLKFEKGETELLRKMVYDYFV
ncbi:hypothetical protein L873DRAFT_1819589 [Choiromyces venosus 120613-1]|uniref:Uncharacterized protein n=1 Tax=Choiromyces venosus 120613-1 TaxID=1336337 RepID=A0A3N4IZ00_9PEZI|nr:hypothetical protein L873DRAFT_1819589 [Choiromyces venosus 120613-1]